MKISELIKELETKKSNHGDLNVVLDDFFTKASREIEVLHIEPAFGVKNRELVLVIRD